MYLLCAPHLLSAPFVWFVDIIVLVHFSALSYIFITINEAVPVWALLDVYGPLGVHIFIEHYHGSEGSETHEHVCAP